MKYFPVLNRLIVCLLGLWIGFELSDLLHQSSPSPPYVFCDPISGKCVIPQMRLVKTSLPKIHTGAPVGKRDRSVWYYLQCSVQVSIGNSSGSGTICHYDNETGEAYVISCGHLFSGSKRPGDQKFVKGQVQVFYKNDKKLPEPQSYPAEVICYESNEDISLMKFHPDWVPQHYFAIAPADYIINQGDIYESTGCDQGQDTAAYTVEIVEGMQTGPNLVTRNNSPRPGRSGGGLMSRDGYFLAIVWGTSELDGSGYGFYVPLRRIHNYLGQFKETKWILNAGHHSIINLIPIYDPRTGSLYMPPSGYLPVPKGNLRRS